MSSRFTIELALSAALLIAATAGAAPSLPITKPPVTPSDSFTGPAADPHAMLGQWFMNVSDSNLECRTHQFHDHVASSGGGASGSLAIQGRVIAITGSQAPAPSVSALTIEAIIVNDAPAFEPGSWTNGINSHLEQSSGGLEYTNTLVNVVLTVNFSASATNGALLNMPWSSVENPNPYRQAYPFISAENQDKMGWYCWNPNSTQTPSGNFLVPGWSFGNIAPGESATQQLQFVVLEENGAPASVTGSRASTLWDSYNNGTDLFVGRTLSLKISNWIADPVADDGSEYPHDQDLGTDFGNVSVFHGITGGADTNIAITRIRWVPATSAVEINSVGSTGSTWQILQACTDLVASNWTGVLTNPIPSPLPATNQWTDSPVTGNLRFYRIVQP